MLSFLKAAFYMATELTIARDSSFDLQCMSRFISAYFYMNFVAPMLCYKRKRHVDWPHSAIISYLCWKETAAESQMPHLCTSGTVFQCVGCSR